jgi:hypothetical protein
MAAGRERPEPENARTSRLEAREVRRAPYGALAYMRRRRVVGDDMGSMMEVM